jgi:hypothetical protein
MFTKNIFTQKDSIADLVKPMLEAQTKTKMEELKGNQAVLDKNKNNKLDADDFKILRGEKKAVKEENVEESSPFDWKKPREPEVKGGAGIKKGRAYGGAAQKSKPEQDDADEKKKTQKEEVEQQDEAVETKKEFMDRQKRLAAASAETQKDPERLKRLSKIPGYTAAMDLAKKTTTKEEVESKEKEDKERAQKVADDGKLNSGLGAFGKWCGDGSKVDYHNHPIMLRMSALAIVKVLMPKVAPTLKLLANYTTLKI